MLKPMPPENNSNIYQPDNSSSDLDDSKKPSTSPEQGTATESAKSKKSWLMWGLAALVVLILLAVVAVVSYDKGKSHRIVVTAAPAVQPIKLPPQAIVTSACTPGRGKQYIIPKDIPQGPIYDVENSKVIAIEYVLSFSSLLQNSSAFSSTILHLTKTYPVDHFTLVPDASQASSSGQLVHLIMFIVPQSEADKITCGGASSSAGSNVSGSTGSTSTGSSSSTSTAPTSKSSTSP